MFKGTIPQDFRAMLYEVAGTWRAKSLAVACSGNFTIERVFAERFTLHSCDVSIYTSALGAYFARKPFRLELRPEFHEPFAWMLDGLKSQAGQVGTLMMLTTMGDALDKNGHPRRNPYYQRLLEGYRRQWPEMIEKTINRLENSPLTLASYNCMDAVDWLPTLPPDVAVASFPPFFVGGYEVMFSRLNLLFDWDRPSYQEIFDERRQIFLDALMNRPDWAFGSAERLDDLEPHLRGVAQTSNRGVTIYLYASSGATRVVSPRQSIEAVSVPRLSEGQTVGDRLWIAPLTFGQFSALRSQYLNEHIKPGMPTKAFAVMVDDKLIGCYALLKGYRTPHSSPDSIYLLSDFAVAPSDYARLSKLVLYAALSKEANLLAERVSRSRIRYVVTTAFTNNPVSMKYRGLFELHSRKEIEGDSTHKFQLQYSSPSNRWTLSEGLDEWKRKHQLKHVPSESTHAN